MISVGVERPCGWLLRIAIVYFIVSCLTISATIASAASSACPLLLSTALGPRSTLSDFASSVDALSVADWEQQGLFDSHQHSSAEYFDSGFSQMVTRSAQLYYNVDIILKNSDRVGRLPQIFAQYFGYLERNLKVASFYGLTQFNGFNTSNPPGSPTFSELELFAILANNSLVEKTRFYHQVDGVFVEFPKSLLIEKFSWMKLMYLSKGRTASQNFNYDSLGAR